MKNLIFALVVLLLVVPCSAEIIIVDDDWPYDFDNIQAAIDYASNGDYIIVFPGTYTSPGNYNIDFLGKAITVQSIVPTDPYFVAQTIIDCNGTDGYGLIFINGEDANSVLAGFTITNCHGDSTIYCVTHPTIKNCIITGNSGDYGNAIECRQISSHPAITNCTISGNSGSGIYCKFGASPVITNCTITGNAGFGMPPDNRGGGIYCYESNPMVTNCTITGNSVGVEGGGIFCYKSSPTIVDSTITGNSADNDGGGIFCRESSPTITGCTISNNTTSLASNGGGIFCEQGSNPTIENCTISGNLADGDGGGIFCTTESNPTISSCTITGNQADTGGGIYSEGESYPETDNCIITGNSAEENGGGIYCPVGGSVDITNCIITGNSAAYDGGGIFCEGDTSTSITSSIIWGNADSSFHGQSAQIYGDQPDVSFSCIQDYNPNDDSIPFGADNFNIDDDPCFVQPGFWDVNSFWHDGDYHLLPDSPCIEAGDRYYTYHVGDVDIDGQPRLMGHYIDMGIDESETATMVVTKPRAGDVWVTGSTRRIEWDSYNISSTVDIYYSDNNGTDWITIDNAPDTGSFIWLLPAAVNSNQCLVLAEPNVPGADFSSVSIAGGPFTIHPDSQGPPVESTWKSLGGNFDRSGLSENLGPEVGCIKWQFQTDGPVSASPSVGAFGRIHLPCEDGNLYTLDANGQLLWSYDTNSPLLSSPSVGPDGSLYVGAENGTLYVFDINGNLRWTHSTDGPIYSSPAVLADGNVYVCSHDGALYALGCDGSELWTFETDGLSAATTGAIFASPAVGPDGTVFIAGFYDPNLYALDPNIGSVKWSCSFADTYEPNYYEPTNVKPRPFASPVLAPDGTIYQTLFFNPRRLRNAFWYYSRLYAIDSNNGNIIWASNMTETPTKEEEHWPPEPNYWFKKYYVDMRQNGVPPYPHTNTEINIYVLRYYRVNNSSSSEPVLGPDGTIYVSFDDQYLRAVDPNGSIKWVTSLGWFCGFNMTVGSDGLIYAAGDDGFLYVLDPDGKEIARFQGNDWMSHPVITADNSMIVCDANNTVWAISGIGCEGQQAALHRPEDLNTDWSVNFSDFAVLADGWLDCTDTSFNPAAGGAFCGDPDNQIFVRSDINRDQYVDSDDLAALANQWLIEE